MTTHFHGNGHIGAFPRTSESKRRATWPDVDKTDNQIDLEEAIRQREEKETEKLIEENPIEVLATVMDNAIEKLFYTK